VFVVGESDLPCDLKVDELLHMTGDFFDFQSWFDAACVPAGSDDFVVELLAVALESVKSYFILSAFQEYAPGLDADVIHRPFSFD